MTRALIAVAAVLAAACAPLPTEHDGLSFTERRLRLESVPAWEMRGRLTVDTGERAFQGRFHWLQDEDRLSLSVRNFLGGGILDVTGSPTEMVVSVRGEQRVLEDPERDLSELLGWWMPVDSLQAWLLGLPDPDFAAEPRIGQGGLLRSLEQRLWNLEYEAYQLSGGVLVPRRFEMTHGPIELRLTVDAWLPAGATSRALNSAAPEQHNTALGGVKGRWGVAKR